MRDILIAVLGLVALAFVWGAWLQFRGVEAEQVACTLDAKICPDGSAVGRVPPDCEFAQCPQESSY